MHGVEPYIERSVEPMVEHRVEPDVEPGVEHRVEPGVEHRVEPGMEHDVEPGVEHDVEPGVEHAVVSSVEPGVKGGGLEIAFFGSSLVSAYWNGAATYYRGLVRALADRGHRVTFFEPDVFERQQHRDIPDPPWARVVVYRGQGEEGMRRALETARGKDLVVKCSGVGAFDELLEAGVLGLQGPETRVAFWDVDAPTTLERAWSDSRDPFLPLIPRFDLVFTSGGGPVVVRRYLELGARACVPIYNALDPEVHFPAPADVRFAGDVGFMGNRLPDREARVEEFFFRTAQLMPERRFVLGGNGWEDRPLPPNVRYVGYVVSGDINAFNSSVQVVLNVDRESRARNGFLPPTRIFEAAGAGACLITDDWEGIEQFLTPGKEVLVARNGLEVAEKLTRLTPERARAIGRAARGRVLAEHTYAHRAAQLEAVLEGQRGRGRVA